jgi:hypothetical protein
MGEFYNAYFQPTSLATDNFQRLFYCQKNQEITFKVTFVANGQISAILTPGQPATENFPSSIHSADQINGSYFLEVTCPSLIFCLPLLNRFSNISFLSRP